MEKEPRYKVGDLVSVAKWDMTERPEKQIRSPARVVSVTKENCGTGFMLCVKGPSGREGYLDQDWVKPLEGGQP